MSTDYGLHCRTCDAVSGDWFRTPQSVADVVRHYPLIRDILAKVAAADLPWNIAISVDYLGLSDEAPHFFLADHYGHDLVIRDEYGRDHLDIALPDPVLLDSKPCNT